MSLASEVSRYARLHDTAHRRWLALADEVQEAGERGDHDAIRRAESRMDAEGAREVESARRAIRAAVALARSQGVEYSSEVPLAVATPGGLLVVHHDERGEPSLVMVPGCRVARVIEGGSL